MLLVISHNSALSHLRSKVWTFFNRPGNIVFENILIFNPTLNVRREIAKTVNPKTCMLTANVNKILCFNRNIFRKKYINLELEIIFGEPSYLYCQAQPKLSPSSALA